MRVAISSDNENGLDSVVSPHFGRCPYFVLVDVEGQDVKEVQSIANPYYGHHQPGQVPGFIHSQGADVMLTGGMGGRAIMFFDQYGIQAATGASGTARHALEQYLGGALRGAAPCRESIEHAHEDDGTYEKDAMGRLREEVEALQQQLDDAMGRLGKLGGE
jgi:predicted Fe-Mo cluster-binding NifX family protein